MDLFLRECGVITIRNCDVVMVVMLREPVSRRQALQVRSVVSDHTGCCLSLFFSMKTYDLTVR